MCFLWIGFIRVSNAKMLYGWSFKCVSLTWMDVGLTIKWLKRVQIHLCNIQTMVWLLHYQPTNQPIQLSCNCILPSLPRASNTHPLIVWLITFQQPHFEQGTYKDAEGHYKCTVWLSDSDTIYLSPYWGCWGLAWVHRASKTKTPQIHSLPNFFCNIWIGRAIT